VVRLRLRLSGEQRLPSWEGLGVGKLEVEVEVEVEVEPETRN